MTVEDREVLREVWEGRIPTVFNLAQEDIQDNEAPDPFYLLIPRMSYLPLATVKVKKYFSKYVGTDASQDSNMEIWFDYKGTPLKWHHPIGALFDLFKGGNLDNDEGLPWSLNIHFSNFPIQDLVPLTSSENVESHFMSNIKEADQLKHAGRVVSTMQKKDHLQLWSGLQNDKFDQFWAINRKFMFSGEENFKHIPIRFLQQSNQNVIQKLVKPISDSTGSLLTFQELKQLYYPSSTLLTQGVVPAPDTPVQWLSRHLSYPDNFLHIIVHPE
ncbi:autophagy protein 5 isoform X2 [Eurytemora carolleeae]|nr:autophagy protein 5 isoform X2 [Eurytemora carolleeae]|eukprot:XP_023341359.1 autophagy protein 5-like isoform X2 [Eurytemora affinis]